MINSLNVLLSL